jgi:hypothetical protein
MPRLHRSNLDVTRRNFLCCKVSLLLQFLYTRHCDLRKREAETQALDISATRQQALGGRTSNVSCSRSYSSRVGFALPSGASAESKTATETAIVSTASSLAASYARWRWLCAHNNRFAAVSGGRYSSAPENTTQHSSTQQSHKLAHCGQKHTKIAYSLPAAQLDPAAAASSWCNHPLIC